MISLIANKRCYFDYGGYFVTADTDSMMIVADRTSHEIFIHGNGKSGNSIPQKIKALSWNEVNEIVNKFECLNPYDHSIVPGSVLKIEKENFDSEGNQRTLFCYSIGPKRYCLLINGNRTRLEIDNIIIAKESGLKFFLNPVSDKNDLENQDFIKRVWLCILNNDPFSPLPESEKPMVNQFSVTTAYLWRRFKNINSQQPYSCQIKPFNFILQASTLYNIADRTGRTLIAPYNPDPESWLNLHWIDYEEPERIIPQDIENLLEATIVHVNSSINNTEDISNQ